MCANACLQGRTRVGPSGRDQPASVPHDAHRRHAAVVSRSQALRDRSAPRAVFVLSVGASANRGSRTLRRSSRTTSSCGYPMGLSWSPTATGCTSAPCSPFMQPPRRCTSTTPSAGFRFRWADSSTGTPRFGARSTRVPRPPMRFVSGPNAWRSAARRSATSAPRTPAGALCAPKSPAKLLAAFAPRRSGWSGSSDFTSEVERRPSTALRR